MGDAPLISQSIMNASGTAGLESAGRTGGVAFTKRTDWIFPFNEVPFLSVVLLSVIPALSNPPNPPESPRWPEETIVQWRPDG